MHEGQVVPVTGVLEAQEKCRLDKGRASSTQHYVHFVNLFVMEAVWCVVDCLIVSLASTPRCQYTHTHTHTHTHSDHQKCLQALSNVLCKVKMTNFDPG